MNIDIVASIVETMKENFDSHDFIKEFVWRYPSIYGQLLVDLDDVALAHAQISNYLLNHAQELGIEKTSEVDSDNLFGHITPCGKWHKM